MSAFQASYSDFKIVKGRKMAQIILEVPLEAADNALAVLGGVPRPDAEVWVGVARLAKGAPPAAPQAEQPAKERRRFDDLPLAQQAALLCQDARFRHWAARWDGRSKDLTEDQAAVFVRAMCGVESRADIVRSPDAAEKFLAMIARYRKDAGMETWTP